MVNYNVQNEPDIKYLFKILDQVLKEKLSREEASSFVKRYNLDDMSSIHDRKLRDLIIMISVIDIKIGLTKYLCSDDEIRKCINKYAHLN